MTKNELISRSALVARIVESAPGLERARRELGPDAHEVFTRIAEAMLDVLGIEKFHVQFWVGKDAHDEPSPQSIEDVAIRMLKSALIDRSEVTLAYTLKRREEDSQRQTVRYVASTLVLTKIPGVSPRP